MNPLSEPPESLIGTTVGGYRLMSYHTSDVLYARYSGERDKRRASVFVMHRRLTSIPGFSKAFVRAAWLTRTISHAGVPPLVSVGETDDRAPYILFDELRGETLESYLERRRGTVPPAEALRIVSELADIIKAAHQQQIVHGGVHPASILLTEEGTVKLLNFGWARLREQAALHLGHSMVPGAAGYFSPQQARGEVPAEVDDVWAIGAILYELLSGRALRAGTTDQEILKRAGSEPAPALDDGTMAPLQLIELLDRALWRDSQEHMPSAHELAHACRRLAEDPVVGTLMNLRGARSEPYLRGGFSERPQPRSGPPRVSAMPASNRPLDAPAAQQSLRPSHPGIPAATPTDAGVYSSRGSLEHIESIRPRERK